MKVLILLSVIAVAFARHQCGENEHFEGCGTPCPLTCDNYKNPPTPKFCIYRCDIGCHCDEGYVRNADGKCVEPQECPQKAEETCYENEEYQECGTACPLTCDNYMNPPKICPAMCVSGCHCQKGYVISKDGTCVKPEDCPSYAERLCGENKEYLECGTACPLTCDNYNNPPKACPAMCVDGCHCQKGYVWTNEGNCVRPENCPSYAQQTVKTCLDNPDPGMCMAYFPSWYYDVKAGKCEKFIYGGCAGNGNRYNTEKECLAHCDGVQQSVDVCELSSEIGPCFARFSRYYFNKQTGQCEKFVYGGCGGNANNFKTEEACQKACAKAAPTACLQEKVVGPCKAGYRRFFFNSQTGKCEEFVYGGCNGNSNNFHSQEECEAVCSE